MYWLTDLHVCTYTYKLKLYFTENMYKNKKNIDTMIIYSMKMRLVNIYCTNLGLEI